MNENASLVCVADLFLITVMEPKTTVWMNNFKWFRYYNIDFPNIAFASTIQFLRTIFLPPINPGWKRIHFHHNADFIHERNNLSGHNDFVNGHRWYWKIFANKRHKKETDERGR